jgi:hypothetical protein
MRHQVVEVGESRQKRLPAPVGLMEAFHREQLALDRVMGLIQEGADRRHLRLSEHRLSARFLRLEPAPDACSIGHPGAVRHVVGDVA